MNVSEQWKEKGSAFSTKATPPSTHIHSTDFSKTGGMCVDALPDLVVK